MRSTMTTGVLEPLSQSNTQLANTTEDIRGRKVYARDGQEFGKVDDVFVDPYERYARFISVKSGDILGIVPSLPARARARLTAFATVLRAV